MKNYKALVREVLKKGKWRGNRTGIDTISLFGATFEHNMHAGLPVLTSKKVYIKGCIHELLWFLRGDTNIKYLVDNDVHIWDAWADKNGDLGPVYGKQWLDSGSKRINQVEYVINEIRNNPFSRRIIIDAWSASELSDMALPPCHVLYQFYVDNFNKTLDMNVYMRSADVFLGLPFDIAEGGLLLSLVAKVTGLEPNMLKYYFGDIHIYKNHIEQVQKQLKNTCYKLPTLELPYIDSIFDYKYEDFKIIGYKHHGKIKGEVAV